MSHLNHNIDKSLTAKLGSSVRMTSKRTRLYEKNAMRSRNTKRISTRNKKTTKRSTKSYGLDENDILSEDGETIRTPKPLFSHNFELMAKNKQSLIEEKRAERDLIFSRPISRAQVSKSILDSSNVRDSSVDKSSDSHKQATSSQMDKTTSYDYSKKSSETGESSEERRIARKKKKIGKRKKEDPEEEVNIILEETETGSLFFLPSMVGSNENEDKKESIVAQNEYYQKLIDKKLGSDNYTEHSAQTMTLAAKLKRIQTKVGRQNLESKEVGVEVMEFTIEQQTKGDKTEFDDIQNDIKEKVEEEFDSKLKDPFCLLPLDLETIQQNSDPQKRMIRKKNNTSRYTDASKMGSKRQTATLNKNTGSRSRSKTGKISTHKSRRTGKMGSNKTGSFKSKDMSAHISKKTQEFERTLNKQNMHLIMSPQEYKMVKSDDFKQNLTFVERILNQSIYHKQYIDYRNYPEQDLSTNNSKGAANFNLLGISKAKEEEKNNEEEEQKDLKHLFKFQSETLEGRSVSCIDFNSVNGDLIAASYGEHDIVCQDDDGYLAFWTLKNPKHPERLIKTDSRVLSCNFSKKNPNLIGTGCYNGVVSIYDIRVQGDEPIADSKELDSKHLNAVWQVGWVGKSSSNDKGEGLISISSDGKVMEWSIKKGLEAQELKLLNRVNNPYMKEESSDTINFRYTTGFSFDFLKDSTIFYFVSTEDGTIHRCSKSYKEQYLVNYYGHTGPVYKVKCNPFWSDIFLSASADWSCRVWNWREEKERLVLRNLDLTDEVFDIEWSPYCSTLFASTAKDGRLELWDLHKRQLDPIYVDWGGSSKRPNSSAGLSPRTTVKFSKKDPVLVSGNMRGEIDVYRIFGYEDFADLYQNDQKLRLQKLLYPAGYNKHKSDEAE